jgi:hypothetical protein
MDKKVLQYPLSHNMASAHDLKERRGGTGGRGKGGGGGERGRGGRRKGGGGGKGKGITASAHDCKERGCYIKLYYTLKLLLVAV